MIAFSITIKDDARPAVQNLAAGLAPARLNAIAGRSAHQVYRGHLFALNRARPNRLGGRRTNFYSAAARGTNWRDAGDHVVVSIASVGIRQRYFGGTIKPKTKKFLAIPARTEAYGKTPREFSDLVFVQFKSGSAALIRSHGDAPLRIDSAGNVSGGGHDLGEVMFWLVTSVTQRPDPSVLPPMDDVAKAINRDVLDYAHRLWSRSAGVPRPPAGTGGAS
jgi:hypothetical protein